MKGGKGMFSCSINAMAESPVLDVEEDENVRDPRQVRLEFAQRDAK